VKIITVISRPLPAPPMHLLTKDQLQKGPILKKVSLNLYTLLMCVSAALIRKIFIHIFYIK